MEKQKHLDDNISQIDNLVIYIIGLNRSGSTLLDNILSYHEQVMSVGELHNLNGYYCKTGFGRRQNWLCSCNSEVKECSFWSKVIKDTSFSKEFITKLEDTKYYKTDILSSYFIKKNFHKNIQHTQNNLTGETFANNTWALYESVFRHSKKNIIIDSSKEISEAYFINKYKKSNIKFLLIERDIWEVVFSKRKRIANFTTEYKQKLGIKENSIYKDILLSYKKAKQNKVIAKEILTKENADIKVVKYSCLAKAPNEVLNEICDFLKISSINIPQEMGIGSRITHTIHGSPSRYEKKKIKLDERWREYYKKKKIALWWARILQFFI
ncbi:sulfotransferase [Winogradskyella bathintestinalis]|uniref:Sulfotransferase n=1 Tax=Winogradskyella bathintestinalis TaxID=3035208 RepID=A0ABT7ZSQ1_9FLAO|nr:sulfotransferase [Winogradskyella bathintestinalis]MDN3492046.1 sulfotransferase [Winogradskyella bathintestinalis]